MAKKLGTIEQDGNVEAAGMSSGSGKGEKLPDRVIEIIRKMWGIGATYSQIEELTSCNDKTISKYTKGLEQGFAVKKEGVTIADPNSPGPKTINEVPTASITSTTPSQTNDGKKPEQTKQLRFEDTISLGPEFTNPLGVDNDANNGVDPEKRSKVDPDSQRKWKRMMMLLHSKAFDMGYDGVEEFMSDELFPSMRFYQAVSGFVKPLAKKDTKGRYSHAEILEKTIMVMEEGMEKITERLKRKKEIEDKMKENNGGDD